MGPVQRRVQVWLEAQVLSQNLDEVLHCGLVHVLLSVIQCVPEQGEGSDNDMKHMSWRERKKEMQD